MPMSPAEIVSSLDELCAEKIVPEKNNALTTADIVQWIEDHDGYESDAELIAYAKKMKARQYARMLMFDDEETGRRIKRLWSFPDAATGRRAYSDILAMSPERRRELIDKYVNFIDQLSSVRRAMSDFLAGQEFFDFYISPAEPEPAVA